MGVWPGDGPIRHRGVLTVSVMFWTCDAKSWCKIARELYPEELHTEGGRLTSGSESGAEGGERGVGVDEGVGKHARQHGLVKMTP